MPAATTQDPSLFLRGDGLLIILRKFVCVRSCGAQHFSVGEPVDGHSAPHEPCAVHRLSTCNNLKRQG